MARYNFGQNNRNYTEYGWKVLNVHKDKNGRLYAVIERPLANDFVIGRGYDVTDGSWAQGEYRRNRFRFGMERTCRHRH